MPQLLGGPSPAQIQQNEAQIAEGRRLSELGERTRLLEERLKQTRERLQVIDETNMNKIKELRERLSSLSEELSGFRKNLDDTKEIVRRIAKDMTSMARTSDVKVLEKYMNMLDITRIATKEDVLRIVKDEISKLKKKS